MTGTNQSGEATKVAPASPLTGAPTAANALRELRRWQLGTANAVAGEPLPADTLPALLAPFRDPTRVRHDYPLLLTATADGLSPQSLRELLPAWAKAASHQPRIVQDNLLRLERRLRLLVAQDPRAEAGSLLAAAGEQMLGELQLDATVAAGVRADLDAMRGGVPAGELVGLRRDTPLRLLQAAAGRRVTAARAAFETRAKAAAEGLRALLAVEAQKDPGARAAGALQKSLGGVAAQFLDPAALARTVGAHRGTQRIDPERRQRRQQALDALDARAAVAAMPSIVVVHDGEAFDLPGAVLQAADDVCIAAAQRYDEYVASLLPVLRAMQFAELEQRAAYDPGRHDPMLAALRWQDLPADALHLLPVVVALSPAAALAGHAMQALTRLLVSGRPIQVLALQAPAADPAPGDAAGTHSRLELGYLGIAFRDAFVQQSTAARPAHLATGFEKALRSARPGLHVVDTGLDAEGREPPLGAFLHAGAAIEGRAHPLFQYDPEAGDTWSRRLDFAHNPAPEADWPSSAVQAGGGDGAGARMDLPFTFADYALLEPQLRGSFAVVPDTMQNEDLVPLADYLQRPAEASARGLPFVWFATSADAGPVRRTFVHRAVVQRSLVHACRDRLRFWRTLQELAGVRNDHVREAVQRARQEAAEQAARERDALVARHQEELERVRSEAAGAAMQGLARMLLELDPAGEAPIVLPRAAASSPAPAAVAPVAAPAAVVAEPAAVPAAAPADDEEAEEPWIDSARCSTCNDCINLNPLMFVYDENKQARIADPRAGTFAQLVQAAEKCPARCIHPGKPLDPDEPDLPALIVRAAPFNH